MSSFDGGYGKLLTAFDQRLKAMRLRLLEHVRAVETSDFGFSHSTAGPTDDARQQVLLAGNNLITSLADSRISEIRGASVLTLGPSPALPR